MKTRRQRADAVARTQLERIPHLFVGGLDVESESNATIQVTNPATGERIGRCPAANARDVEKAVGTARAAFEDGWTSPAERAEILFALAEQIDAGADDLAILETLQTGKTFRTTIREVRDCVRVLRYFAGWVGKLAGETHDLGAGVQGTLHLEPHPVVAAVLPLSEPFPAAVRKVGAAVAVGACSVLLPPKEAPLTVLELGELCREAGLPPGVVNVVTGNADPAGEALSQSRKVTLLLHGGPLDAARRALVGSAKTNLKPVELELGDKTACVLFEDGKDKEAVEAVVGSIFSGRCVMSTAISRFLVHESIYEDVANTVAARARETVLGDPLDEHTQLGPMPSEDHMKRVLQYVELARREGAKVVAGGSRDVDGSRAMGAFVKPTVLIDVKPGMRIAQEDVAGPVLCLIPFASEEEAVHVVNGTDYGLAAAVFTRDLARAQRVARHLDQGVVWINQEGTFACELPFGGSGLSGAGRDLGQAALRRLTRAKSVYWPSR